MTQEFWRGRTFDDFLLRPQHTAAHTRAGINLRAPLAGAMTLELPILSANMDSVTGEDMARALALEGGIGVVHRGWTIERQAQAVAAVKRSHSAIIDDPQCLPLGTSIRQARTFARRHRITGILVETAPGSRILAGLLSHRDMPWNDRHAEQPVEQFMTPCERLVTAPPGVSVAEAARTLFERRIERLPIIDAQRRIHGLITRKDLVFLEQRPFASKDARGRLLVGAAVGVRGDHLERAAALVGAGADCLFVDIAHGHAARMEQAVAELRAQCGEVPLVCGNVATAEGAAFLRDIGADAVKIGVGPGRGCRTRLETAAGVPQLQAIREAWSALRDSVPIVADGGVRADKDIVLALLCGATTVMLGSALSGTDEAPGRVIEDPVTHAKTKLYRGMTAPQAVADAVDDSDDDEAMDEALATPAEGQELQVPYKGGVGDILHRIRGHLRSAVSYAGETSLAAAREKILREPARYLIPLSAAARRESFER